MKRKIKIKRSLILSGGAAALLGQENGLDVGQDASLGDGDSAEKAVQLLVVADGELEVTRVDPLLLVVSGGVPSQLQDLCSEVLHHCGQVDGGASTHSLGVVAGAEKTVDSADWELEPSAGRAALGLGASLASFASSRHVASKVAERESCEASREMMRKKTEVTNFALTPAF